LTVFYELAALDYAEVKAAEEKEIWLNTYLSL
jgi:hypothetical protein